MEKHMKVKNHSCFWKRRLGKTMKGYHQSNKIRELGRFYELKLAKLVRES